MQGPNQNNNINFLLNPSSTSAAMIDPNLDATDLEGINAITEGGQEVDPSSKEGEHEDKDEEAQDSIRHEEQVAALLRSFDAHTPA